MSTPPQKAPPRLIDGDTATGRLLQAAADAPLESSPVRRERVWIRMHRRSVPLRFLVPAMAALGLAVAAGWNLLADPLPLPPATLVFRAGAVEVGEELWKIAEVGQALRFEDALNVGGGRSKAFARFSGGGAMFLADTQGTVQTDRGRVELRLPKGQVIASSNLLTIIADELRIEGTDALFSVKVAMALGVEVIVYEGVVQVRGPGTKVKLSAGQSWSSKLGPGPAGGDQPLLPLVRALAKPGGAEAPLFLESPGDPEIFLDGLSLGPGPLSLLASVGAHTVTADEMISEQVEVKPGITPQLKLRSAEWAEGLAYDKARQLALDGRPIEAVAGYEPLARGTGSRAEAALYEIGRIRLRLLKDASGALSAFAEHQRRFPTGALIQEVALSAIEAQLELGQLEPALAAMEAFLARFGASERRNDVHFLQARVHAEKGNCAVALRLFAGLREDPKYAADALYLTAYCERAIDDLSSAQMHLRRYLSRYPKGKYRDEAKAGLGRR